ncbi:MAG TPA: efflux RND transporter periplasmic adaptor subunit [Woeseiaceae bacterium]|nr:efflux RND transporter periplasmic adaptor subunit [Woeseiaceae bacterium]
MNGRFFSRYRQFSGLAGAACCLLILSACGEETGSAPAQRDRRVRVIVEPLAFNREHTRVEAVGTSRAVQSIVLHPAVSGEVVAVDFEPGQAVAKGDVLVALDQRDEELAVRLAEVRLHDAERLYERYQRTGDSGAVLPTTLDAARTAVESARIELDRARIALDYRTIEAPFAGFVGITDIDPGDRVNADTQITTLDDRSSLLVSFDVPESLIDRVAVNDEVAVATWNSREPRAYGEIVDIGSRIDPVTRTFEARALVENREDDLRPGMSFRVTMTLPGIPYPVVPETGVQWGADGAYIWSVADRRARRVPVSIVQRRQGQVLVEAPELVEGDLIVVEGIQRLRDGIEVSFARPSLADRSPPAGQPNPVGTD